MPIADGRAVALGGIGKHEQLMALGNRADRLVGRRQAEKVDRNDRPRL